MMRRSLIWFVNFEAVFMPALSPSMETGTVVEWKKKVGDLVKENDVFCTIQTDKAVVDYTNTFEPGYLAKIFVQNGQTAAVAKTIAVMVDDAADVAKADEFKPDGEEAAEEEAAPAAAAATSAAPAAAAPAGAAGGVSSEPPEGVDVQAVFMPALSPSMETGTVVEWKKKVGDLVKENEVFCTIQTDKAVVDYTNTFEPGYLAKIFCENGQSGEVAKTIALMVSDPSEIPKVAAYVPEDAVGADAAKAAATAVAPSTPAASSAAPAAASAAGGVSSEPPEGVDVQAVFMPALSPSMETGTVVEWKKKVGDLVKENEVFCTIQTDKAVVDYTNTFEPGYLAKVFCENGQSGEVAKTIALMVSDPSEIPKVASYVPEDAVGAGAAQATAAAPAAAAAAPAAGAPKSATPAGGKVKRYGNSLEEAVHASGPSVIRIAAGLDDAVLEKIVPTGKDGRFRKEDFQGQPGFDYNDPNVTIKHHAGGTSSSSSASAAKASPTATGLKAATSVGSQAGGNIYNVVISAGKVKKPIDDTPILRKLISTMPIPKPKKAKKAA